jgi:hypothetical protein
MFTGSNSKFGGVVHNGFVRGLHEKAHNRLSNGFHRAWNLVFGLGRASFQFQLFSYEPTSSFVVPCLKANPSIPKYSVNWSWNRHSLFLLLAQDDRFEYIHSAASLLLAGLRGKFELYDAERPKPELHDSTELYGTISEYSISKLSRAAV